MDIYMYIHTQRSYESLITQIIKLQITTENYISSKIKCFPFTEVHYE